MSAATNLPNYPSWTYYYETPWTPETFSPEATPYFGTNLWPTLTDDQKTALTWGFIQINAEVIIHLEQGLLIASREMRRRGVVIDEGLKTFIDDEIVHIDAFRDYLVKGSEGAWPENSLLLYKQDRYRKFCAWLYRWEPLCVFLPGAKSEIYAVQYHVAVRAQEKHRSSKWAELVHLHAIDEASHITKDFEVLRTALASMSLARRLKLCLATFLCVLMTQYSLALPTYRLIKRVFPRANLLQRIHRTYRFAAWVLWTHPAFPATRKIFSRSLKRESDSFFRLFAFLGW